MASTWQSLPETSNTISNVMTFDVVFLAFWMLLKGQQLFPLYHRVHQKNRLHYLLGW
jgi:hypothetical protein